MLRRRYVVFIQEKSFARTVNSLARNSKRKRQLETPSHSCHVGTMAKRPSPDSVICIDLTEDDDERQEKLKDVRKRLKGTPAASATSVKAEGLTTTITIVVDLVDDDDGGGKIGSCAALQRQQQQQQQNASFEVEIVQAVAPVIRPVASAQAAAATTSDDDIVVVGTANESRLPHMRQHCSDNMFAPYHDPKSRFSRLSSTEVAALGNTGNREFCNLCFCYVCDKPAKDCSSWNIHCHATDTGAQSLMWTKLRKDVKQGRKNTEQAKTRQPVQAASTSLRLRLVGNGHFAPGPLVASDTTKLTECRKCGFSNRFLHHNFSKNQDLHPTGCRDWCRCCGRVASEKDFGKLQAEPYVRQQGDFFVGEKVVPFRIIAHDPRKMKAYRKNWALYEGSDPKWTFSEAEMEEDVFKHRLGEHPSLEMILASIPVVSPENIPETGSFNLKEKNRFFGGAESENREVSADETEAIILQNRNDVGLLQELINFGSVGCDRDGGAVLLDGDITAAWNSTERSGVSYLFSCVAVHVHHSHKLLFPFCFRYYLDTQNPHFSSTRCLWFPWRCIPPPKSKSFEVLGNLVRHLSLLSDRTGHTGSGQRARNAKLLPFYTNSCSSVFLVWLSAHSDS
jgi:hypothetical protein